MSPSFTLEQFLDVMARYNAAFWPLRFLAYLLGILAVIFTIRNTMYANNIISVILAAFWIWVGIVFNWMYFSKLSATGPILAVLFVIEGVLLIAAGVFGKRLSFKDAYGVIGWLLVLFGMVGYPAIEYLLGRGYY
jgi:uncharacterized membrane protein HdeD (DUF308 family)